MATRFEAHVRRKVRRQVGKRARLSKHGRALDVPPTARPWFRLYSDILDSHKVDKLNDRQFRRWIKLLALANVNDPRGRLPTIEQMAYRLRIGTGPMKQTIEELVSLRFIDADDDGFVMHDWDKDWQRDRDVAPDKRTGKRDDAHANVTETSQDSVTRGRGEVEVDKEKEEEVEVRGRGDAMNAPDLHPVPSGFNARPNLTSAPDLSRKWGWDGIRYAYETNVGALKDDERMQLKQYASDMQESWVVAAINETHAAEKPCFAYFKTIMDRCWTYDQPPSSLARAKR